MKKHLNLIVILTILASLVLSLTAAPNAIDFDIVRPQYNEVLATESMPLKVSFSSNMNEKITRFSLLLDDKRFINGTINNPLEKGSFEFNGCDFSSLKIEPGKHILTVQLFDAKGNRSDKLQVINFIPTETTPPVVTIVEPSAGTKINGQVQVRVVSVDDSGIDMIEIYVDNTLRAMSSDNDFAFNWDPITEGVTQGSHTIHAVATDIYGNTAYSNYVMVLVENPYQPGSGNNTPPKPTVTTQFISNLATIARSNTPLTMRTNGAIAPNTLNTYGTKLNMLNKSYQKAATMAVSKNNEFKIVPPISANKISALKTKNIKAEGYLPIITVIDKVGAFKEIGPDAESIRKYYNNEVLPLLSIDSKVVVPTSVTVSYNTSAVVVKPTVEVTSYIAPTTTIVKPEIAQTTLPAAEISVAAAADVIPVPAQVSINVIKSTNIDAPAPIKETAKPTLIAQALPTDISAKETVTIAPAIDDVPQIFIEGPKGVIEATIPVQEVIQIAQAKVSDITEVHTMVVISCGSEEVTVGETMSTLWGAPMYVDETKVRDTATTKATATAQKTVCFTPATPISRTYTVKAGDTLNSIAAKNNTTVEKLKKENPGINPNLIKVGQKINIPMKKGVSAYLNNEKLDSELTSEGYYLISLRSFADANGDSVMIWLPKTKEVEAYIDSHRLIVKIGEKTIKVDEKMLVMPIESVLKEGRTYVPAALFRDGLGYSVNFEEKGLILTK